MSIEIYYYSGTGNSLHVARELQTRIPEASLTPIVHLLHDDAIKASADTIGFAFPNFCLTIPIPLHDFLEKADLSSAQYIFALCTRGGSQSEAFEYMNQLLEKRGKKLNAQLDVNMPWNLPLGRENLIGLNSKERMSHLESVMLSKLDVFGKHIVAGEEYIQTNSDADHDLSFVMKLFDWLVPKGLNYQSHRYMYQELVHFYANEDCSGCGICEKVCLSEKIAIVDKKPSWRQDVKCYACFACINFCPKQAIQIQSKFPIRSYTNVNPRYHHQSVTWKDIAQQR